MVRAFVTLRNSGLEYCIYSNYKYTYIVFIKQSDDLEITKDFNILQS